MTTFTKNDALRWLSFSLIALAVLVCYYPSLYYPPRADQVIYLSETSGLHKPWDLIFGCYNHNRHRTIAPGDELLFRPLLYAFLGVEQVLFGHHFWAWQLTALGAHLVLIWVLLRLLWHVSGPWLAFAGAWSFALAVSNYELVTWPHLSSYLLMMACVIASVEQMVLCFEEGDVPQRRIIRLLVYFFIACFIYETANIFALMITAALGLGFPARRRRAAVLLIPVVLYVFFSLFDYFYVDHVVHAAAGPVKPLAPVKYLIQVIHLTLWWFYQGLFSGLYHYKLAVRTMFLKDEVMVFKPLVGSLEVILSLISLGAFSGLAWFSRAGLSKRAWSCLVLSGMLLAYTAVIVAGRWHEKADLATSIGVNSYFSYIFWAIAVMLAFMFLSDGQMKAGRGKMLVVLFVIAGLVSGSGNGKRVYGMALDYSRSTRSIVLLVTTLDLLIQEKGKEPGFSFYVDPQYPGNYPYPGIQKIGAPSGKVYSFAEFLYPQYFRPRALAMYRFLTTKEKPRQKTGL